jgi:transcription termination factor Rho
MHLNELKALHVSEVLKQAEALEIENTGRMRKQELMFAIMKKRAKAGEQVFGDGVLEVLPDGFGFLRSSRRQLHGVHRRHLPLAEPDPPLQPAHRRHDRRRGAGAQGRRALLRAGQGRPRQRLTPEESKHKIMFENLTPLFPKEQFKLERDIKGEENITGRIIDLIAPIGKGQRALLVAQPKSGKTVMMQHMAHAIVANHPEST